MLKQDLGSVDVTSRFKSILLAIFGGHVTSWVDTLQSQPIVLSPSLQAGTVLQ